MHDFQPLAVNAASYMRWHSLPVENRNAVSADTGNTARSQHTALRRQVIVDQLLLINKETLSRSIAVLSEKDIFSSLSNLPYFF